MTESNREIAHTERAAKSGLKLFANSAALVFSISLFEINYLCFLQNSVVAPLFNPVALRKAKIVYNFGLSECIYNFGLSECSRLKFTVRQF